MTGVQHVSVTQAESGQKLVQFLNRRLGGGVPRSAIMRWVRTGQVRVDSSRAKPFQKVTAGQTVRIPPYRGESGHMEESGRKDSNPFRLRRVYEDEELLLLAKPPGLATQPGKGVEESVDGLIRAEYRDSKWPPALVHRLDKETSGLLVLAKSYSSLRSLQRLWRESRVHKLYLAWVSGDVSWSGWTELREEMLEDRDSERRKVPAVSRVRVLRRHRGCSLVAVSLDTGRKHQIRIQMAGRGHPVVGDRKYGSGGSSQGLLLHAYRLAWPERDFTLPPPWLGRFAVSSRDLEQL
ncbi:MAG: RluA family pseudouridine synthase [Desulfohalobiaceae bacterium]|nr:RluA family pseudouridine synthase [Desulfohalobiaceae bacterium]